MAGKSLEGNTYTPKVLDPLTEDQKRVKECMEGMEKRGQQPSAACLYRRRSGESSDVLSDGESQKLGNGVDLLKELRDIGFIYSKEEIQKLLDEINDGERVEDDEGKLDHSEWEIHSIIPLDGKELLRFSGLLLLKFGRYPEDLSFPELGLKNIVPASEIKLKHKRTGKIIDANGIFINGHIFLTPNNPGTLDHEIFHLFDTKLAKDNILWKNKVDQLPWYSRPWPWNEGEYMREDWTNLKERPEGFVSRYATYSINEDQAETFSYMMMNKPFYEGYWKSVVTIFTSSDGVIQEKVSLMKELTAQLGFNEEFWNSIKN